MLHKKTVAACAALCLSCVFAGAASTAAAAPCWPPLGSASAAGAAGAGPLQDLRLDAAGDFFDGAVPAPGAGGLTLTGAPVPKADAPAAGLGEELKLRLLAEWKSALAEFESTREHAAFLEAQGIPILFPEKIGNLLDGEFIASYEPDGIHMGEAAFGAMARGLLAQGVREGELPRVLALKTLGVLGHEIRHGITAHELRSGYGVDFQAGLVEDEVIAHFDQLKITDEVKEKNPLLWWDGYDIPMVDGLYDDLRRAWDREESRLEYYIRNKPPMLDSVLSSDREAMAERFRGYAAMIEKSLKRMAKRGAELRAIPESERSAEERRLLEKIIRNSALFEANLKKIGATLGTLDDPEKFQAMRAYYWERMSELHRQWQRDHGLRYDF